MFMAHRVLLILLVPLLLHGAPTPPGSQPLPSLSDAVAGPGAPEPKSTSHGVVLADNACILLKGSRYRTVKSTSFRLQIVVEVTLTRKDRVVYTKTGRMIFVPKGSTIKIGPEVHLPSARPGESPGIYFMDGKDDLAQSSCALSKETKFYTPEEPNPEPSYLNRAFTFSIALTDQVGVMPNGRYVFIPLGTTITLVEEKDHVGLPTGSRTKIRIIDHTNLPMAPWTEKIWTEIRNGDFDIKRT